MDLNTLGKRIQLVRESILELKQAEFAEQVGTVQTLISRLERGIGGNIHLLMDIIAFLHKRGYPAHLLFAAEFSVDAFNKVQSGKKTLSPVEQNLADLKAYMQKGYESAITLETIFNALK